MPMSTPDAGRWHDRYYCYVTPYHTPIPVYMLPVTLGMYRATIRSVCAMVHTERVLS